MANIYLVWFWDGFYDSSSYLDCIFLSEKEALEYVLILIGINFILHIYNIMTKPLSKELEDIFLDTIIMRVEQIQKLGIKRSSFASKFENNVDDYQDSIHTICNIILEYIEQAQHLVKQKNNYEALLLDRMVGDGVITTDVYTKYSPIPIDRVELLLPE